MKEELPIEQKAKAYDKALERAKQWHNAPNADKIPTFANRVIEEIFPELKESEDESIKREIIGFIRNAYWTSNRKRFNELVAWLEKQGKCETDCRHNHQDANYPNGCIVLEDFNGGEGFYKVHLDYLNEKQVEEIEEMIRTWNKDSKVPNENIKNCIGMCLTDVSEQRFKDYNTSLKDCLAWLKSLTPQNRWKPSNEQIGALEHFVRSIGESGFTSPYESNTNLVYSLLSELKKLKGM